jgi:hypothetical protein
MAKNIVICCDGTGNGFDAVLQALPSASRK